jgi:hypothetical protein
MFRRIAPVLAATRLAVAAFLLAILPGIAGAQPALVRADPTSGNVTIKWTPVTGATSYTLYMATAPGVGRTTTGLPGFASFAGLAGTSFTHPTGLANGTTYFFVVTATGPSGESIESREVASAPSATVDAAKAGAAAAFAQVAAVVNAQGTGLSSAHILPLLDPAYLNDGMDGALSAKLLAADLRGATLGALTVGYVDFYDEASRVISAGGTVSYNGEPVEAGGLENGDLFTFRSPDGGATWKPFGNQRIAHVAFQVEMRTESGAGGTVGPAQFVNVDVEAPVGTVASITVTGPGLASPLLLTPATVRVEQVEGEPGVLTPVQRDAAYQAFMPGETIRGGVSYDFAVTRTPAAGGGTATGTVTYPDAVVTEAVGGAVIITAPAGHQLADASLGNPIAVGWVLPTAYPVVDVSVESWAYTAGDGFQCRAVQESLGAGATGTTLTLPVTCNGQAVVRAGIGVMVTGEYGRRTHAVHHFDSVARTPLALATATITLDGGTADWAAVPALVNDPAGDALPAYAGTVLPGSDIRALHAASDATYLYLRLDLWDAFNTAFGNGVPPFRGSYRFRIETASGTWPLLHLGVAHGVYHELPEYGQWVLGYNGANGLAPGSLQGASYVAVLGPTMEIRIPWSALGGQAGIYRVSAAVIDCCTPEGAFNYLDQVGFGPAADTTAPTVPSGFTAVATGATQVTLSWNASADDTGVVTYVVFRDGAPVAGPAAASGTTWIDTGRTNGASHAYYVMACDAAANCSAPAGPAQVVVLDPVADADADGIPNGVEIAEGRNPLEKDNDVFGNARLFAMQMYRDFLDREGDAGGIQGWADAVTAGTWTRLAVIDGFLSSAEFAGNMAPVVRLYFATFLRVPDYGGLVYNAGLVRAGTVTLTQLADFFTASPEFQATYGALDNAAFVTLLYNNVLGRAPDAGGLAGWVALLEGGYTRGQVLLGFSDSPEYQAQMANEVFVTMMYAGMLRRTPEASGFGAWVSWLDAGSGSRELVIGGFFGSTEYHGRFLP